MIRAAAKNFADTLCVSSMEDYEDLLSILSTNDGEVSFADRKIFAAKAFNVSSHYDTAIFNYFNDPQEITTLKISELKGNTLRYG